MKQKFSSENCANYILISAFKFLALIAYSSLLNNRSEITAQKVLHEASI